MAATAEDRSGALIAGKYRLLRLLGRGGMGAVYEAENTWTKRHVAIKLLRPEYATDRTALRRFMQEAQSATQIAHPNIVDVLDLGLDEGGGLFMVPELLEGHDLRARLDDGGPLPVAEVLDVMVPILGALAAAHHRGVVHRDLKPENIFLSRGPGGVVTPKLIDFGVSKVLDAKQRVDKTGAGTAVGTPRYMAPEQIRGDADTDARADVWSLGVVLYEILSGTNPFAAPTAFAAANRVLTETPAPPEGALSPIVTRAMRPAREDRYASVQEMLDEILAMPQAEGLRERHRSGIELPTAVEPRAPTPIQFSLVSQLDLGTAPTQAAVAPRRRWWILVVIAIVATTILWIGLRREPPPPIAVPPPPPKIEAPKPEEPKAVVEPAPAPAPAKKRPAKRPPPAEGANRAPIVE